MNRSLHNLLSTVHYNPAKDTLFLTGDILAKSTEAGSLAILDFLTEHRASTSCGQNDAHKPLPCKPIHAVRGNHDQMIVQWRAWRDWFEKLQLTFPSPHLYPRRPSAPSVLASTTTTASYDAGPPVGTGSQFLALIETEWLQDRSSDPNGAGSDAEEWVDTARKRAAGTWRAEWWKRIPQPGKGRTSKDYVMFSDHYWIARDMERKHAEFLYSLPLVIHIPTEHIFLVHGGLVPSDPRHPSNDERQPLAHPPSPDDEDDQSLKEHTGDYDYPLIPAQSLQHAFPRLASFNLDDEIEELRVVQERALLHDVPQNRDPWAILNMRGVRKGGKITRRSDKGTPWAKIWNNQMKRCVGFENVTVPAEHREDEDEWREKGNADPLPCYPSTVVYGHAASRDLDVRRWTVGIDTGCLYGRRLTALVLTRPQHGHHSPTPTSPTDDDAEDEDEDDEDESSEEEEDEQLFDEEYAHDAPLGDVNARYARVRGGSVVSRARRPKTWTRKIRFGDREEGLGAKLVSIKCPKVADLS
ncbi:hypothetical protein C8Q80DRAFT_1218573 [Daedaleopsis nitida]|nr:hypothetical protein C8Q80DRAFT_1218573 [Daedaleopsis nitida]